MKRQIVVWIILLGLVGYVDDKSTTTQQNEFADDRGPKQDYVQRRELSDTALKLEEKISSSNNAIQQETKALVGTSIGKVAEQIDASLVRLENNMSIKTDAKFAENIKLINEIKTEFKNDMSGMKNELEIKNQAIVKLQNEIKDIQLKVELQNQAQIGNNQRLDSMKQEITAGRDAIITTSTQYTKDMAGTIEASYKSQLQSEKNAFWCFLGLTHMWMIGVITVIKIFYKRKDEQNG